MIKQKIFTRCNFCWTWKKIDRFLLNHYKDRDDVKKIVVFDEWYYNYKEVTKFKNDYLKIDCYLVNDSFCYNKAIREGLEKKFLLQANFIYQISITTLKEKK